jgi:hypothetical protein
MEKAGARPGNMMGISTASWEERINSGKFLFPNYKRKLRKGDLIFD